MPQIGLSGPAFLSLVLVPVLFLAWASNGSPLPSSAGLGASGGSNLATRDDEQCGFDGNADFYGLGIRLGVYLQWTTAFLANTLLESAVPGNLETNCIFLVALFTATASGTARGTIRAAEALVLLHLFFGFVFSILTLWGRRTRFYGPPRGSTKLSLSGSLFRLALTTMIAAYSVWFWFWGFALLGAPPCPAYTFVLSRQNVRGPLHLFYEVQSAVVMAVYGMLAVGELVMVFWFLCFTIFVGGLVAGVSVHLATHWDDAMRGQSATTFIKRWATFSFIIFWSGVNGESSSLWHKHSTMTMYGTLLFIDMFIFLGRSTVQILCLGFFKKSPPIGQPPLLLFMALKQALRHPVKPTPDGNASQWSIYPVIFTWRYWRKAVSRPPVICVANAACIVWAIIAIELTLVWNKVSDVYDLASTGQLIPFVIAIVSFLRLCHALTVEQSSQHVTDAFMSLLDENPKLSKPGPEKDGDKANGLEDQGSPAAAPPPVSYVRVRSSDEPWRDDIVRPLGNGFCATFPIRRPVRRHSIDMGDPPRTPTKVQVESTSSQSSLDHAARSSNDWRPVRRVNTATSGDAPSPPLAVDSFLPQAMAAAGLGAVASGSGPPAVSRSRIDPLSLPMAEDNDDHFYPIRRTVTYRRHDSYRSWSPVRRSRSWSPVRRSRSRSRSLPSLYSSSSQTPRTWRRRCAVTLVNLFLYSLLWPFLILRHTAWGKRAASEWFTRLGANATAWMGEIKTIGDSRQEDSLPPAVEEGPTAVVVVENPAAWGPHLSRDRLWTAEQKRRLKEEARAASSFLDLMMQVLDLAALYAARNKLREVQATAQRLRAMLQDTAATRRRFKAGGITLKAQHVAAVESWEGCMAKISWVDVFRELPVWGNMISGTRRKRRGEEIEADGEGEVKGKGKAKQGWEVMEVDKVRAKTWTPGSRGQGRT